MVISLLRMQHAQLGTHCTWQLGTTANHYTLIKQLELAAEAGLYIRLIFSPGPDTTQECDKLFTRLEIPKLKPSLYIYM